ncbi:MAG TPA: galactokinase, partial [Candidatus Dormibacteraeota bacterium]|nr:galactokinase [Candidatus Dormibacteraeota bacterium]
PSGLMDQVACLCGQAGHALLFDAAAETVEAVRLPRALALLVLESGVPRRLAASEYGVRATEAAEALRLAGARLPRREPAASERASSHHASLAAILAGLSAADLEKLALPPPLDRRLRHIATEVARVGAAVEALVAGDLPRLGRLLLDSHASLRDDHQVSLPELDALVDLAVASGCLGARLMGAGFGGSVLAVAEAERAEAALVRIRAGHPGGRAWLLQAAGGARVLDLRDGAGPKRA